VGSSYPFPPFSADCIHFPFPKSVAIAAPCKGSFFSILAVFLKLNAIDFFVQAAPLSRISFLSHLGHRTVFSFRWQIIMKPTPHFSPLTASRRCFPYKQCQTFSVSFFKIGSRPSRPTPFSQFTTRAVL